MDEEYKNGGKMMADLESAARFVYSGRRILVTGAAGSIGSELITKLIRFAPTSIAALDKDGYGLNELAQSLAQRQNTIPVEPYVADIRDAGRLESICQSF